MTCFSHPGRHELGIVAKMAEKECPWVWVPTVDEGSEQTLPDRKPVVIRISLPIKERVNMFIARPCQGSHSDADCTARLHTGSARQTVLSPRAQQLLRLLSTQNLRSASPPLCQPCDLQERRDILAAADGSRRDNLSTGCCRHSAAH